MTQSRAVLFFLLVICCFLVVFSIKKDYSQISSGFFADNVVKTFGMAVGGVITISYDIQPAKNNTRIDSYVLILVVNERQRESWYNSLSPPSSQIDTICSQPSFQRIIAAGKGSWNVTLDESVGSNQFSVLVMQCREDTGGSVSINMNVEMKNIQPSGGGYSQLGIDRVMLVNLYGGEIIVYVLLLAGLLGQIYLSSGQTSLYLHYLFLGTVILYLITTILNFADYNIYNREGEVDTGVDLASSLVGACADVATIASLLLLSLGWQTLRSQLTRKEIYLCWYMILSYLVFNIASASCLNSDSLQCQGLSLVAFVIRSLILLTIIIAMNFTVTQIRAILVHSTWVPSTPIQYARCKQYQVFRWIFILYILLPSSFLIVQVTMYSWEESWVYTALVEFLNILFMFHIGVTFSPLQERFLIRAFDGTAAAAANAAELGLHAD